MEIGLILVFFGVLFCVGMVSSKGLGDSPPRQSVKQYGVTKPISVAGPTEVDIQRSLELEKVGVPLL